MWIFYTCASTSPLGVAFADWVHKRRVCTLGFSKHIISIDAIRSTAYTYDSLNRLSTVTDNRTGGVTTYAYDGASNVATVTYPNGVQTLFHYDTLNRVLGATTQQTGYIYQRGPTGNLTSAMDANGRTVNWSYDGIYRLTGECSGKLPYIGRCWHVSACSHALHLFTSGRQFEKSRERIP